MFNVVNLVLDEKNWKTKYFQEYRLLRREY